MVGLVLGMIYPSNTMVAILAVLSVLPVLFLIANILLSKQYVTKINRSKVADMQSYMLRHRAEAEKTATVLLRRLQRMRRVSTIYTIILWCLAACASLLGGILYEVTDSASLYIGVLYSGTIFFAIYTRIRKKDPIVLNENALILSREEYPRIYATATRAAEALNCRGNITILLSFDCNASIARDGNKYYLLLGVVLLNILSEDELYCICVHEFSHCSAKNAAIDREQQYSAWLSSRKNISPIMLFFTNFFVFFDVRYLFDHMTYDYATSVIRETEADRDMAKHGTPEIAASALLKLNYDDKFRWESGVKNETTPYASETPNPHYMSEHLALFKNAITAHHEAWDEMLAREILPNNASHPIFKMRLETLGVNKVNYVEYDICPTYQKEQQQSIEFADKNLYDIRNYENDRKEYYLDPLARITEWKNNGMPISAETYADIITDLKSIGLHEEAETLCDRAMQELDENSSQHAYFIKGCALLYRYDESGMDLIYHAIESNHNYLEEGLQIIGTFCCTTGREKDLLEYRQRAQKFAQKDKDEYSETGFLSKDDNLSRDDMPREMLEEILAYIKSVDGDIIENIYLVRKTISNNFFTSAFVIHFYGGTDEARNEIMHKIFRYLDTYPVDWQFSLFDYFDYPKIKFDKIEGSLVYSKSKN